MAVTTDIAEKEIRTAGIAKLEKPWRGAGTAFKAEPVETVITLHGIEISLRVDSRTPQNPCPRFALAGGATVRRFPRFSPGGTLRCGSTPAMLLRGRRPHSSIGSLLAHGGAVLCYRPAPRPDCRARHRHLPPALTRAGGCRRNWGRTVPAVRLPPGCMALSLGAAGDRTLVVTTKPPAYGRFSHLFPRLDRRTKSSAPNALSEH